MEPTWLQTEKELERIVKFPQYSSRENTMMVYSELSSELSNILAKGSFKISHGYNSSKNWYEMVWYPHQRIERLFIRVKSFDGKTLSLQAATDLEFKQPVSVTFEKEMLYSWLSCLVDEIFVQAI